MTILIANLHIHTLSVPLGGQVHNPRVLWHRKQSVLLSLETKDGQTGWGECWCFDTSCDALVRFLQTEIRPRIEGREIGDIGELWQDIWALTYLNGRHGMTAAALSGVDIALHDLKARAEGKPLGVVCADDPLRPRIPVYASGGLYHTEDSSMRLAQEMAGYIADGHTRVKMKIGGRKFEEDVARMRAVRGAIGVDAELIVDAVYSLDRTEARKWLPVWAEVNIEAVQAPFAPMNWDDMIWLNHDCGVPVMVFEAESRFEIFRALLQADAIGVLQFSPIAVGGITAARQLIALGREYDRPVSLQCSSTWLGQTVALELARGHETVASVELHTLHRGLFDHVHPLDYTPKDGWLTLSERAGLGFVPDASRLAPADITLPDFSETLPQVSGQNLEKPGRQTA